MAKLEIRITVIYPRGVRGHSKTKTFETDMGMKQARKKIWAIMEGRAPVVTGDYIADFWISEIQGQTELTIEDILKRVYHIQRSGHDALVSTSSYRVPLAYIAEDHNIQLTDGSEIEEP